MSELSEEATFTVIVCAFVLVVSVFLFYCLVSVYGLWQFCCALREPRLESSIAEELARSVHMAQDIGAQMTPYMHAELADRRLHAHSLPVERLVPL